MGNGFRRVRSNVVLSLALCVICVLWTPTRADDGDLEIHFIDVGQGDGAVLVSPGGEVVLFDNGVKGKCRTPLRYLRDLEIDHIDYHITSHYHADHIGCTEEILEKYPLQQSAIDRGGSYYSKTYKKYVKAVGTKRRTADPGETIVLDASSPTPVRIEIVALNGNGISTRNENDLSLVAAVRFGDFDVVIGGDLSGYDSDNYEDIETSVARLVGQVEVYKVHHHCSKYSTNDNWLDETKPRVAVISVGNGNRYGHPTFDCLERLHLAHVTAYWTERGKGAEPEDGVDIVGGSIVVTATAGGDSFTVTPEDGPARSYPLLGEYDIGG